MIDQINCRLMIINIFSNFVLYCWGRLTLPRAALDFVSVVHCTYICDLVVILSPLRQYSWLILSTSFLSFILFKGLYLWIKISTPANNLGYEQNLKKMISYEYNLKKMSNGLEAGYSLLYLTLLDMSTKIQNLLSNFPNIQTIQLLYLWLQPYRI